MYDVYIGDEEGSRRAMAYVSARDTRHTRMHMHKGGTRARMDGWRRTFADLAREEEDLQPLPLRYGLLNPTTPHLKPLRACVLCGRVLCGRVLCGRVLCADERNNACRRQHHQHHQAPSTCMN